ncbi:MAG: exocyst complex component Sec6, partial [Olpidium bornovanus]
MANLLKTEQSDFVSRENPPEADANGVYGTQAAVIMFQMCVACLRDAQKKWTDLLESEFRKQVERPQEGADGLVDYVIAVANDHLRCGEFAEGIARRMDRVIEDACKPRMNEALNGCVDGFMKVARHADQILIDIAFHDVRGVFAQLFTGPWYDGDLMSLIILTLNDYLTDYQQHLQEYLLSKLTGDMLDRFLASYIEAMRNKGSKFRIPAALDRMTADIAMSVEFFSRFKSAKRVEKAFDVLHKLQTLLGSSKKMVFLDYYSLKKAYNDVPLAFVEDILSKRDDMDKASLKDAMESIRAKAKEEPI